MVKKFLSEFKEFALRGNVVNLAVGMITGIALQGLVSSLTDNMLSPIIGLFVRQNFNYLEWHVIGITLRYGAFLTSLLNFVIMMFVAFWLVRAMNKLLAGKKGNEEESEPRCKYCMTVLHKEASRCPACTSLVDGEDDWQEQDTPKKACEIEDCRTM